MNTSIQSLIHQTPLHIEHLSESSCGECINFYLDNGKLVTMYHSQDCCEDVHIDGISGNLDSLLFKPLLQVDEKTSTKADEPAKDSSEDDYYNDESYTWTFYTLANISSVVDIRWYGSSNGYYSESVNFSVEDYDLQSLPNYQYLKDTYPNLLV